jgi:hypothetical protein
MQITKYNKAIVAVLTAGVVLWNTFSDQKVMIDEGTFAAVASVVGTLLVYLVPNKSAA